MVYSHQVWVQGNEEALKSLMWRQASVHSDSTEQRCMKCTFGCNFSEAMYTIESLAGASC